MAWVQIEVVGVRWEQERRLTLTVIMTVPGTGGQEQWSGGWQDLGVGLGSGPIILLSEGVASGAGAYRLCTCLLEGQLDRKTFPRKRLVRKASGARLATVSRRAV